MFALPLITPTQDFSRYLPTTTHSDANEAGQSADGTVNASQQRRHNATAHPSSTIAALKSDEALILQRKTAIARFGATWIKPPGVSKTLQAETEERQEREEQEILARREQMMLDMQAQQEAEEARQRAAAGEAMDEEGGEEQRDLDDDVPDGSMGMDADLSAEEGGLTEEDELSDEDGTTEADMTFNDGSLIEGSMLQPGGGDGNEENSSVQRELAEQERYAQIEEAELTGVVQEEFDLDMEGNLDDSVPEAGSYQHTDTELEDDDSDDDEDISFSAGLQQRTSGGGLFDNRRSIGGRLSGGSAASRASLSNRDASSLLDSSFVTSSPVTGRMRTGNNRNSGRGR
ncbi:hypothetical protein K461DRAFT_266254 [Myriangium duriaei CBS 260.36]|uniref:Apc15p protein-domain-containing protein n=1 Tax=Myriangium duriaei CBS 260.36 TaxID=1168546 RepID=A0A9P4MHL3_9PEZI|nr:hypothetical protein K461DRAFT_266254 [Myriangium duriaei CBS 260.36]